MINRLLIANRGEIAVRIIRACRELGIESVAVYSDADADALHVRLADRAIRIGPAPAAESYLAIPALIEAARGAGAQAIHPGYGFLSERAAFAKACAEAGLIFVGPPADVIARMGSKVGARRLMQAHDVPVVPGETPSRADPAALETAASRVGYPLLLKPSAGGGGIGMRVVREASALAAASEASRREARAAFGDDELYVERLIERARHVEVQVLGDAHGRVLHFFERECSVQRRHQKVIEESPSPAVTPALRQRMVAAAVAAARAAAYRNAGTVEFLVEGLGDEARFYFLEMNTRLQVEHPVTEAVTGVDLVAAQLRVASGEDLALDQEDIVQRGHAIECRIYAEDPLHGFLPQAGRVLRYREPSGPGVRVDSGITEGAAVPVQYDPLLAKLVVHAETRQLAIARARAALKSFVILGIRTNVPYLLAILEHPSFTAGEIDTGFLDRDHGTLGAAVRDEPPLEAIVAAAAEDVGGANVRTDIADARGNADPWSSLSGWRIAR
ncbi:MAG TPA: acetyl-CoA carboxylase biotin carboxylase subunit [Vicinamibacterales bacterium]|nr:acetyl-CoA carboxylase biotin carboxylase subunit [Vicinamibacterales bacterium]